RDTPGVASSDTLLAVAVGRATGRLGPCLRSLKGRRVGSVWLEVVPRFLYPLCLLLVIANIVAFLMIYILPKYQKIFNDFRFQFPEITTRFASFASGAMQYLWTVPMVVLGSAALVAVLCASTVARWFFPIVGRFY